jgi:hypothetical protein
VLPCCIDELQAICLIRIEVLDNKFIIGTDISKHKVSIQEDPKETIRFGTHAVLHDDVRRFGNFEKPSCQD